MGIYDQDTAVSVVDPVYERPTDLACLVLIHRRGGLELTKRVNLDQAVMRLGRDARNDIVLEDEEVSRHHARLERRGKNWILMDVGSRNGTFLNDREVDGCIELRRGDLLKLGTHIFKFLAGEDVESAYHDEIYKLSITDNLTGLSNRRSLLTEGAREFSRARRHTLPTSCLLIDVDHFKRVNDDYGHQAGDAVLARVAAAVRAATRAGDTVARYGGEELAVLMPQTHLSEAVSVANRTRSAVENLTTEYRGYLVAVTVSIGCAELASDDPEFESLLRRADEKLYAAKRAGRNRVEF